LPNAVAEQVRSDRLQRAVRTAVRIESILDEMDELRLLDSILPEDRQEERRQWALAYDSKAQGFAACRLLQQLGNPRICPPADAFVQWHDEASRARTGLPLA
jgi:hypothetical protein